MSEQDHLTEPLYISYDDDKSGADKKELGPGVQALNLYSNPSTGEGVQMLWLEANTALPLPKTLGEGEELLVLQGSLTLQTDSDNTPTYKSWGWLRFPASSENSTQVGTRRCASLSQDGTLDGTSIAAGKDSNYGGWRRIAICFKR